MKNKKSLMYEDTQTCNAYVGCRHECIYCYARTTAARQRKRCEKHGTFEPHFHPEQLEKFRPRKSVKQVFLCSLGDPAYASYNELDYILLLPKKFPKITFLIQSKNPSCFTNHNIPDNLVVGTTIETNRTTLGISKAPYPIQRKNALVRIKHRRKYVTIEPILQFDLVQLVRMIKEINPEFVYVGYDNHHHDLDEPTIADTLELIEELKKFTEVRLKTI